MKHHKKGRKLGRVRKVRVALLRSLARALVKHGRIKTSVAKAKELRPFIEKMVTIARNDTVANRRLIFSRLGNDNETTKILFEKVAPNFKDTPGGYTRIVKLGVKADSSTDEAIIEFVK